MTFKKEDVDSFLEVFENSKQFIRATQGCTHLELWRDINTSNIFFTHSHWLTEQDLENYRNSELFKQVWKKTKPKFEIAAEAWSLKSK
jgi:heme-degrading monooxygenase HmoA